MLPYSYPMMFVSKGLGYSCRLVPAGGHGLPWHTEDGYTYGLERHGVQT